jgi:hypothetical protein
MENEMVMITDDDTLERFVNDVDGLHDALLRKCIILHEGYVDTDGRMYGDAALFNAKLLFHSQYKKNQAFLVALKDVSEFRLYSKLDFELEAEIDRNGIHLYLCGRENKADSYILAKGVKYCPLPKEYLGNFDCEI